MTPASTVFPRGGLRAGLFFALVTSCASAQTTIAITGGDAGEGLTLDPGRVVHAYNIRGVSTFTVQNVTFTNLALGVSSPTTTPANPFAGGQTSADDLSLKGVLQSFGWDGGGSSPTQIAFTNLTPNATYRIDLMYYAGSWNPREMAVVVNDNLVGFVTASLTVAYNTYFTAEADGAGSIGLLVTRSGLYGGTGPQDGTLFNAVVLSAIPEPAGAASFAALASFGWVALRRRRRRGVEWRRREGCIM